MRSQREEKLEDPLINKQLHLVLLSTVSETFTSGKPCFDQKMKGKFLWLWFYKHKFLSEDIKEKYRTVIIQLK